MKIAIALTIIALFSVWYGFAHAQAYVLSDPACNVWLVNPSGAANAPVTVGAASTVVIPAAQRNSVCGAMVANTGANPMTCAPATVTVTATNGDIIAAGDTHVYGWEIWPGVNCFSTAGSTVAVQEVGKGGLN